MPAAAAPPVAEAEALDAVGRALRGRGATAVLLGGRPLRGAGLVAAHKLATATGARLYAELFPTRLERGAGVPPIERLAYFAELASVQLAAIKHLILVDAKAPVSFFAYPGKKSYLVPDGCEVHELVSPSGAVVGSLEAVLDVVGATGASNGAPQQPQRPARPTGELNADKVCQAIAAVLPEGAIVSDESQTSGVTLALHTAGAPRHDLLALTGGANGQGLPLAGGGGVAGPGPPGIAAGG